MPGFPTVPSRDALGVPWDTTGETLDASKEVSGRQLQLIGWQATGLGVGVGGLLWALIQGSDGSRLSGGECWNPNGNPSLSLVLATAWAGTTSYGLGAMVANGGALYKCIAAGTSAGSGGPTGTGNSIPDGTGTLVWAYVSTGGYVVKNGTGSWTLVFAAAYPDETGTLVPLNLQVAKAKAQTTSDLHEAQQVSGVNVIDVRIRNSSGVLTDCNFVVEAR